MQVTNKQTNISNRLFAVTKHLWINDSFSTCQSQGNYIPNISNQIVRGFTNKQLFERISPSQSNISFTVYVFNLIAWRIVCIDYKMLCQTLYTVYFGWIKFHLIVQSTLLAFDFALCCASIHCDACILEIFSDASLFVTNSTLYIQFYRQSAVLIFIMNGHIYISYDCPNFWVHRDTLGVPSSIVHISMVFVFDSMGLNDFGFIIIMITNLDVILQTL